MAVDIFILNSESDVNIFSPFKARWMPWLLLAIASPLLVSCAALSTSTATKPKAQVRIASGPPFALDLKPIRQRVQPTQTGVYIVQPGDTLWAVAVAHDVDLEALATWNLIDNPDRLFVGQGLYVQDPAKIMPQSMPVPQFHRLPVAKVAPYRMGKTPKKIILKEEVIQEKGIEAKAPKKTRIKAEETPARWVPLAMPMPMPEPIKNMASIQPSAKATLQKRNRKKPKPAKSAWVLSSKAPKRWLWPLEGRIIGKFRSKGRRRNTGIDIETQMGTPVHATAEGIVAYADNALASYGKLILLRHGGSFMSAYAHNDKILVKRGDQVFAGEVIAHAGKSGRASSPRLHFELRKKVTPLNPMRYLPKRNTKG